MVFWEVLLGVSGQSNTPLCRGSFLPRLARICLAGRPGASAPALFREARLREGHGWHGTQELKLSTVPGRKQTDDLEGVNGDRMEYHGDVEGYFTNRMIVMPIKPSLN